MDREKNTLLVRADPESIAQAILRLKYGPENLQLCVAIVVPAESSGAAFETSVLTSLRDISAKHCAKFGCKGITFIDGRAPPGNTHVVKCPCSHNYVRMSNCGLYQCGDEKLLFTADCDWPLKTRAMCVVVDGARAEQAKNAPPNKMSQRGRCLTNKIGRNREAITT